MSKRFLRMLALILSGSLLWAGAAHACADLNAMLAGQEMYCEGGLRNEPLGKPEKANCDAIRYSILATQVTPSHTALLKLHAVAAYVLLPIPGLALVPLFSQSQAPPGRGLGVSGPHSHVILRI